MIFPVRFSLIHRWNKHKQRKDHHLACNPTAVDWRRPCRMHGWPWVLLPWVPWARATPYPHYPGRQVTILEGLKGGRWVLILWCQELDNHWPRIIISYFTYQCVASRQHIKSFATPMTWLGADVAGPYVTFFRGARGIHLVQRGEISTPGRSLGFCLPRRCELWSCRPGERRGLATWPEMGAGCFQCKASAKKGGFVSALGLLRLWYAWFQFHVFVLRSWVDLESVWRRWDLIKKCEVGKRIIKSSWDGMWQRGVGR